jgi:hypothetical protein
MADKKKKGRRAYLSDYVLDVSGEYIYTGDYYIADTQGKDYKRICRARLQRGDLQTIHCRTADSSRRGVFCEERQGLTDIGIQVRLRRCRRSAAAVAAISEVEK